MRLPAVLWMPWRTSSRAARRELQGIALDEQERQAAFDRLSVQAAKNYPDDDQTPGAAVAGLKRAGLPRVRRLAPWLRPLQGGEGVERRVPTRTREIAGATLTISTMGGYSVLVDGDYIGFMHATQGGLFNAYQRVPGERGNWLGQFAQEEAVRVIMRACGRVPARAAV